MKQLVNKIAAVLHKYVNKVEAIPEITEDLYIMHPVAAEDPYDDIIDDVGLVRTNKE